MCSRSVGKFQVRDTQISFKIHVMTSWFKITLFIWQWKPNTFLCHHTVWRHCLRIGKFPKILVTFFLFRFFLTPILLFRKRNCFVKLDQMCRVGIGATAVAKQTKRSRSKNTRLVCIVRTIVCTYHNVLIWIQTRIKNEWLEINKTERKK